LAILTNCDGGDKEEARSGRRFRLSAPFAPVATRPPKFGATLLGLFKQKLQGLLEPCHSLLRIVAGNLGIGRDPTAALSLTQLILDYVPPVIGRFDSELVPVGKLIDHNTHAFTSFISEAA